MGQIRRDSMATGGCAGWGKMTYHGDGSRVQDVTPHVVHNLELARQTDVCDESPQGTPLQAGQRFGLGRDDGGNQTAITRFGDFFAQVTKVLDILSVYG